MRITQVETYFLKIPYRNSHEKDSFDPKKLWNYLLVKISTDEGVTGWGEPFGVHLLEATKTIIDLHLAPRCIGRDPLQRLELMRDISYPIHNGGRNGPPAFALSGIELALWDIAAKAQGVPLHRLLGSEPRSLIPVYASFMPFSDSGVVIKATEHALKAGFTHIKLHEKTTQMVSAARNAAGAGTGIMLDVNCPWSVNEALEMAKRLEEYELFWLEEPVWPPEDYQAIARVRQNAGIAVAAGENIGNLSGFKNLLQAGAVDYVQPSIAKCGGVNTLLQVIELAESQKVRVAPHSFYFGPGFLATLHVLAACPKDMLLERVFCELETDIYPDGPEIENGFITPPDSPGLGPAPDPKVLERYRAA